MRQAFVVMKNLVSERNISFSLTFFLNLCLAKIDNNLEDIFLLV